MTGDHQPPADHPGEGDPRRRMPVTSWLIIGISVLGTAIYLFIDHLPHVVAVLPYVAIIGMAAMHLFGHRHHTGAHDSNHRRHGGDSGTDTRESS
ncbi:MULTISPECIES: DUF2933 domain-containing protein [Gordonia]|uniref:DUF2933 domain-containing protein n=1 Tax=Gordonia TaxID=2053 RepID=UPI0004AF5575|nr:MULTISPECIES: DUF2933 domain-containing protein [Gordonia]KSU51693.1 hypothetical protein AS181_23660 [Gordonia sp. SGD-V-85]MBA5846892.1 DUF2933 domain-containing protein [Gordonia amicalis]WJG15586.1 DUF2933 domain-containing protein [Gordonia sp. Swx-4]SCC59528.1 Protein of unknown function [Gordonia sp. v-85]